MDGSQPIPSQALHEWFVFGLRAIVDVTPAPRTHQEPQPVDTRPPEVTDPDAEEPKPDKTEKPTPNELL
jgi:hypothetical protein